VHVQGSPVELSFSGGVADLRISGAIDLEWARMLRTHAAALREHDDVRVVRIWGAGRFFCPGGDLRWMADQTDRQTAVRELADTLHAGLLNLAALDAPIVAQVHGVAAGAGVSLVLGADIAIAGESATFSLAYSGVGLSPDGGSSWLLPRIVGYRRALEIMLLNPTVDAHEAARLGMVSRAVPDDDLSTAVDGVVSQLAAGPTAAFGAAKRLARRSLESTFEDQLDAEAGLIAKLAGCPAGTEGIRAFIEKRRPVF
jgi:2-(1,2-epoxy-1,2-dihydrophenyl)acetyl-CoA isomerase